MCKVCQEAKNKWFHRIVMKWKDISLQAVKESINNAFGKAVFDVMFKDGKINWGARAVCKHCGERFSICTV